MKKILLLISLFVSLGVTAQEIRVSREHKSNTGRGCFSISSYNADKNEEIETEAIFSWVRKGDDNGFKHFIASIPVDKFSKNGEVISFDDVFLCLDHLLNVRFLYPMGTKLALPFQDGISRFALNGVEGQVGVVDSLGNLMIPPVYDYITKSGSQLNGISVNKNNENEVVFQCSVFTQEGKDCEFSVLFDDGLPMSRAIHNEFECLVEFESFQQMLKCVAYNEDELNYLHGIFNMLNLNFKTALAHFNRIENQSRFKNLRKNNRQCKKL